MLPTTIGNPGTLSFQSKVKILRRDNVWHVLEAALAHFLEQALGMKSEDAILEARTLRRGMTYKDEDWEFDYHLFWNTAITNVQSLFSPEDLNRIRTYVEGLPTVPRLFDSEQCSGILDESEQKGLTHLILICLTYQQPSS